MEKFDESKSFYELSTKDFPKIFISEIDEFIQTEENKFLKAREIVN